VPLEFTKVVFEGLIPIYKEAHGDSGGGAGHLNLEQLNRWLTPLANIALLAGLILVAYELNQNRSLARMELVNEGNVVQNQIWANLMGEVPGEVIARALECPEEMTYADFMAMDAFLFTSLNTLYRNYELAEEGIFTEEEWRQSVETYASWFLGSSFGRVWWEEEARSFFPSEFANYVDEQVSKEKDSYAYWLKVRSRLLGPEHTTAGPTGCKKSGGQPR
jgi:hypothetical protein